MSLALNVIRSEFTTTGLKGTLYEPKNQSSNSSNTEKILFIHGLAACRRVWDEVALELVNTQVSVATFDLRNHGESVCINLNDNNNHNDNDNKDDDNDELSIDSLCDDIHSILIYLNWINENNITLIGHSFGANLALIYTLIPRIDISQSLTIKCICLDGGYISLPRAFTAGWHECISTLLPKENFFSDISWKDLPVTLQQMFPTYSSLAIGATIDSFIMKQKDNHDNHDNNNNDYPILRLHQSAHEKILHHLWKNPPSKIISTLTSSSNSNDNKIFLFPSNEICAFSRSKKEDVDLLINDLKDIGYQEDINIFKHWLECNHQIPLCEPNLLYSLIMDILS